MATWANSLRVAYLIDVAREAARKNEDLGAILNHSLKGRARLFRHGKRQLGQGAHFFVCDSRFCGYSPVIKSR